MPLWAQILFFVFVAPPLWLSVSGAIAWIGGWRELASHLAVAPGACEMRFPLSSISLRSGLMPATYRNCVTVRLWTDGFGLAVPFLFLHPPVLVPWSAIRELRTGGFIRRYVEVALTRPDASIRLYGPAGSAVHQVWLSTQPVPALLTPR